MWHIICLCLPAVTRSEQQRFFTLFKDVVRAYGSSCARGIRGVGEHGRWLRLHRRRQINTTPKVALVTGASSDLGQATEALLAAQGFRVFGTSRAALDHAASSYEVLPLDVRSEASIQACVQTILQRTGRIDLLVNNAGFAQRGALEETSLEGRVLLLGGRSASFQSSVASRNTPGKLILVLSVKPGGGNALSLASPASEVDFLTVLSKRTSFQDYRRRRKERP